MICPVVFDICVIAKTLVFSLQFLIICFSSMTPCLSIGIIFKSKFDLLQIFNHGK